jgi:hypothetical protein
MPLRAGTLAKMFNAFVLLEFYPPTDATTSSLFLDGTPYSRLSRFKAQAAVSCN